MPRIQRVQRLIALVSIEEQHDQAILTDRRRYVAGQGDGAAERCGYGWICGDKEKRRLVSLEKNLRVR